MPTYTYECENCHHHFEIFQHFTEDTLTECPSCKQQTLRKTYTPVGIVFKGSGFYATDHRSPSGQTPLHHESSASEIHKEGASSESAASSSSESKTESAPAKENSPAPASASTDKK